MRKLKPSMVQEEILYVMSQGGSIRCCWVTFSASLIDPQGFCSSVSKATMEVMTRNDWIEWDKARKVKGSADDFYRITSAGLKAIR